MESFHYISAEYYNQKMRSGKYLYTTEELRREWLKMKKSLKELTTREEEHGELNAYEKEQKKRLEYTLEQITKAGQSRPDARKK